MDNDIPANYWGIVTTMSLTPEQEDAFDTAFAQHLPETMPVAACTKPWRMTPELASQLTKESE
jgi:hypothetical protein